VDTPHPLFTSELRPTSMLQVLKVFSHLQNRLIPVASQRDPVSIYATQDDAHQAVSLLFVNKSAATQVAQVRSQNQLFGLRAWTDRDVSISAYSITLVTLRRQGETVAYRFKVPAAGAALSPLTRIVCGNAVDALAHDIPC
jgi:hypothetical protein